MSKLQAWRRMAFLAFLTQGLASTCQKALTMLQGEYRALFLFALSAMATLLSALLLLRRRERSTSALFRMIPGAGLLCRAGACTPPIIIGDPSSWRGTSSRPTGERPEASRLTEH